MGRKYRKLGSRPCQELRHGARRCKELVDEVHWQSRTKPDMINKQKLRNGSIEVINVHFNSAVREFELLRRRFFHRPRPTVTLCPAPGARCLGLTAHAKTQEPEGRLMMMNICIRTRYTKIPSVKKRLKGNIYAHHASRRPGGNSI